MVVDGREHFLSFEDFPWFRGAAVQAVFDVKRPHADHLRWPELDVDLALESIEHPERFPLKSRAGAGRTDSGP
ncbi:MAG: DUF2442 domain-containing protein [Candidatus Palauibacterales bacterium]|nr:DUF2442 domain-containing protein [Candidatus Palauibacterales bacterium]MDP2531044.1 DUF2442 domain-containing protein [Candidatus Palauibacterales bacterium]MDP2583525.1 DUF2442 domain-containing protein [Candidatus Palauibacterales bacterium]